MKLSKKLIVLAGMGLCSLFAVAQETPSAEPKMAVFVKNQTKVPGMDDLVDGVRDRMAAELAGAGMRVMDQAEVVSGFTRYKVTTAEERAGLVDGIFSGASAVRAAQMIGADYVMTASILSADRLSLTVGGKPVVTFTLRMAVKVVEAAGGASVYGETWTRKVPVPAESAEGSGSVYFNDLLDAWASETGAEVAEKSKTWKQEQTEPVQLVSFSVSTTLDELVQGLETGVRAPNELLDEVRHVIGGATVEIDGAAVGSSPGTFRVAPGLHQMRVSRQWMKDWQETVMIQEGSVFKIGLELSDAGMQRFQSLETFKTELAKAYAEALLVKGIKINFDTSAWRDVTVGEEVIQQKGTINTIRP